MPRVPDSRTLTFEMWVIGADSNGRVPTSATMRAEFEKNFNALRDLFWNQGRPVSLTKRWKEYGSSVVQTATATAIYAGGFEPQMNGSQRASFSVDLFLPDPFFYGPQTTLTFPAIATSNISPVILGDYETTSVTVKFEGVRNNVRLTNISRGIWVNVNESLGGSVELHVNVKGWTAIKDPGNTNVNVIRDLTYFGHTNWFSLSPGTQTLSMTSSTGASGGTVVYRPKYL